MKNMQVSTKRTLRVRLRGPRLLAKALAALAVSYILSGASLLGQALPLAACYVAALRISPSGAAAAFGAIVGYFTRCSPPEAVEYVALVLLVLLTQLLFQGTGTLQSRWFLPVTAAVMCGILGSVRLLGSAQVRLSLWCSKCLLTALCTDAFTRAVHEREQSTVFLAAAVVSGLCGRGSLDLGPALAVALCSIGTDMTPAAVFGLSLDLSGAYTPCATLALTLPALVCHLLKGGTQTLRSLTYVGFPLAVLAFFDALSFGRAASVLLGALGGALLHRLPILPKRLAETPGDSADSRLEEAAQVLELLCGELPEQTEPSDEAEQIFDAAAERVCRRCPRFQRCWNTHASQTCRAISPASERILRRGLAYAEDFSAQFRDNCIHLRAFVDAVNRELEGMLFRRRYRLELGESRRVIRQEYDCVAQYLRAARQECARSRAARFFPSVNLCCAGKESKESCGDRGVCFSAPNAIYYVLLCDGMGTGDDAARLSTHTVHLLKRLLQRGLAPMAALKLLNGSMLLRGSSSFSTVDLLQLDLHTGQAQLYKWGAAPSYRRDNDRIEIIGTGGLPPGVGVEFTPEQYNFSLRNGELLVMLSDGAYSHDAQSAVEAYRNVSARELAALLIAQTQADDDMTAIVVTLLPRLS